jgi:hypothetical protein
LKSQTVILLWKKLLDRVVDSPTRRTDHFKLSCKNTGIEIPNAVVHALRYREDSKKPRREASMRSDFSENWKTDKPSGELAKVDHERRDALPLSSFERCELEMLLEELAELIEAERGVLIP